MWPIYYGFQNNCRMKNLARFSGVRLKNSKYLLNFFLAPYTNVEIVPRIAFGIKSIASSHLLVSCHSNKNRSSTMTNTVSRQPIHRQEKTYSGPTAHPSRGGNPYSQDTRRIALEMHQLGELRRESNIFLFILDPFG